MCVWLWRMALRDSTCYLCVIWVINESSTYFFSLDVLTWLFLLLFVSVKFQGWKCWLCFDGVLQEVRYVPQIQSLLLIILNCLLVCCSRRWMRLCIIKCVEQAAEVRWAQEQTGSAQDQLMVSKDRGLRLPLAFSPRWGKYHTLHPLSVHPSLQRAAVWAVSLAIQQCTVILVSRPCCVSHLVLLLVAGHQPTAQCIWAPPPLSTATTHTHKGHFIYTLSVSHSFTMIS